MLPQSDNVISLSLLHSTSLSVGSLHEGVVCYFIKECFFTEVCLALTTDLGELRELVVFVFSV